MTSATVQAQGRGAGAEPGTSWALDTLTRAISFRSESGAEGSLAEYLASEGRACGLEVDLWEADEGALVGIEGRVGPHKPLAGRPTLVLRLAGSGGGRSLMFNAHSDVVGVPDASAWSSDPWTADVRDGAVYGRGACDDKGPLVAALWAMRLLAASPERLAGDVLLEIVPGEEDCVGVGTLTSIARGYRADGAVVLEPTTNLPRCASRAGCRFEITTAGRAVHGTVKWLGVDAIGVMHAVQRVLAGIEREWNDPGADPLFAGAPITRPVTLDSIHGAGWQGMLCDRCTAAGYLELLPTDDIEAMKASFGAEVRRGVAGLGYAAESVAVGFTEEYRGHRIGAGGDGLLDCARGAVRRGGAGAPAWVGWEGFNSGCEAGVRAWLHGTPTLVWGPGDLAHAHATDEHVRMADVGAAAQMFVALATEWCNGKDAA